MQGQQTLTRETRAIRAPLEPTGAESLTLLRFRLASPGHDRGRRKVGSHVAPIRSGSEMVLCLLEDCKLGMATLLCHDGVLRRGHLGLRSEIKTAFADL